MQAFNAAPDALALGALAGALGSAEEPPVPFFFVKIRRPTRSTLFPYTTLFRARHRDQRDLELLLPASSLTRSGAAALGYGSGWRDRKSTRLNSSHANISYAVFCLKKKKKTNTHHILKQIKKNTELSHQ